MDYTPFEQSGIVFITHMHYLYILPSLVVHQTCGQLVKLEKWKHSQGIDILLGSSTNLLLGTTIKKEDRGATPCEDRQEKAYERILIEDEFEDNNYLPEIPPKMPESELNEYPSWASQINGNLI
jgi:hypothetical protein